MITSLHSSENDHRMTQDDGGRGENEERFLLEDRKEWNEPRPDPTKSFSFASFVAFRGRFCFAVQIFGIIKY